MQEMLTMHITGFSWRGVGVGPIVSKFLVLWGISGASFGYLASQIYGQESLLIIWFTAYWDKEFHTAIWMPNLVYFKGFDFQVVLFILWEPNTFHMPHCTHKNNLTRSWLLIEVQETEKYLLLVFSSSTKQALAIWFITALSYVKITKTLSSMMRLEHVCVL